MLLLDLTIICTVVTGVAMTDVPLVVDADAIFSFDRFYKAKGFILASEL